MKLYKVSLLLLSIGIMAAILYFSDPLKLAGILAQSNIYFIIAAVLLSTANMFLRVIKWRILLNTGGILTIFQIQLVGSAISNLTPGKVTEPSKAVILKMCNNTPVSSSLPSIIWERLLDVAVLLVLSFGIFGFISADSSLFFVAIAGFSIFLAMIAALVLILYSKRFGKRMFSLARRLPLLKNISAGFMENFYSIKISNYRIAKSFILSLTVWLMEGFVFYFCLRALGIDSNPFILAGIIAFSILIGVASSLPGGIGSTEFVMIILLGIYGIPADYAIIGTFLYRFVSFWYGIFLGGVCFTALGRRISLKNLL